MNSPWDWIVAVLLTCMFAASVIGQHRQPFLESFYSPQAARVFDSITAKAWNSTLRGIVTRAKKACARFAVLFSNEGLQRENHNVYA